MVNAGAIATTSLVPGATADAKWRFIHDGLSRFAGRKLPLNEEVYASASETNFRNRSIARLLQSFNRIYCDPAEATDLYTRQCSLNVSAKDLAVMGATLADGGVNPLTKERVVDPSVCHYALAVMTTAGLYETSGDWLYDIGLPGKSGIGGGIVTVSPGKGGLGTFAPPLDSAGNSVKGQLRRQVPVAAVGNGFVRLAACGVRPSDRNFMSADCASRRTVMTTMSVSAARPANRIAESWVPMIAIALGQMIMSFNVASLPVALGGMVKSFSVPPTTVATGIVAYSMLVAGFVMLGAKLNQRYGALHVFRAAVVLFGASQVLMTFSPTATLMITAQALCGAAGAVIVPSLVALIAENYRGRSRRRRWARWARRAPAPACWRS